MEDVVSKRTPNSKTFEVAKGQYRVEITQHKQHYNNKGILTDINTDWEFESAFGQKVQKADYHLTIREKSLRFGFSKGAFVDYSFPCRLVCYKSNAMGVLDEDSTLQYTATPDSLKLEIILTEQPKNPVYSIPVTTTGCEIKSDGDMLLFVDKDIVHGCIPAPYMYDAEHNQGPVTVAYKDSAIVITPDEKWLSAAVYPVVIDPTTTLQVGASANDGYTYNNTLYANNFPPYGPVGNGVGVNHIFSRFTNVTIPNSAIINSAKIQYCSAGNWSSTAPITRIYLNNEDNATAPTTYSEYIGKSVTSAYVDWTITAWTKDTWYDSPDITTVVQEVVDRAGWTSGNAMLVLHKDNGSASGKTRSPYFYEQTGNISGPKLVIEYTESTSVTAIGDITGTAQAGQTLTAGSLTPSGATVTYQWKNCSTADGTYSDISGATSSTYVLQSTDIGKYIKVTATGTGNYTGTVTSAATNIITAISVTAIGTITGSTVVGQTLTAGALTPSGATVSYQWKKCSTVDGTYSDISGATSSTYVLQASDEDYYIKVAATGTDSYSGTVTSTASNIVTVSSGVTLLNWMNLTANQYFWSGITAVNGLKVELKCTTTAYSTTQFVFGGRVSFSANMYTFLLNASKFRSDYASNATGSGFGTPANNTDYTIIKDDNITYINGSQVSTYTAATFNTGYELVLCSVNTSGTVDARGLIGKFYYCKIWDASDVLLRDFVPVLDEYGVPCLYDYVTETYVYNSGTNTAGITYEVAANVPTISVTNYTKAKISDETGMTTSTVTFRSDTDLLEWEARATTSGQTPARGTGILVGSGTTATANSDINFDVDYTELSSGDQTYVISVYGRNTTGWSIHV